MRYLFTYIVCVLSLIASAQNDTEIYVFSCDLLSATPLSEANNISRNKGYDNQPYFCSDSLIVYAGTLKNQTEIYSYQLNTEQKKRLSYTVSGSEYSPQNIPNSAMLSAVRLDTDGKQGLYAYNPKNGDSKAILPGEVIAYPYWIGPTMLMASVIENDQLHLYLFDLVKKTKRLIAEQSGRFIQRIPNSDRISYTKQAGTNWELWAWDPSNAQSKKLFDLGTSQEGCWLPNGLFLCSQNNNIIQIDPKSHQARNFYTFTNPNTRVSRLACSPSGKKIAVVTSLIEE